MVLSFPFKDCVLEGGQSKDVKKLTQEKGEFKTLSLNEQQAFLISILNKNQLYKNLSEMDDKALLVDEKTKTLNTDFYVK